MGGSKAPTPPPPVDIPKPTLDAVPSAIEMQAFNSEMYAPANREAAQRAYNLQAGAAKFRDQQRAQIEAANAAKMQQYNDQVAAAEAQRQAIIASQQGGKRSKYPGVMAGVIPQMVAGKKINAPPAVTGAYLSNQQKINQL